ncbi:hypothetical protein JNB48_19390 [Escherichia coli]|uniref:hypothetical protein n=1 Tax=Escherichia coli TaxID=562 RepID=UPI00192E21E9|nr:hypothetical protein [Escherichia coli]MBL6363775.1 hypothetical protein [Escherichia coli]
MMKQGEQVSEKYELVKDLTMDVDGVTLYRIRALRDIPHHDVEAGDLGGWVEGEHNLSQHGDSWVGDNAKVSGAAWVFENAWVYGDAQVYDNARVFGDAQVHDKAIISGNARVSGHATISGEACIRGMAQVCGAALVGDQVTVCGNAIVMDEALVEGVAEICDHAKVYDDATVKDAHVRDRVEIAGNARVNGYVVIMGVASLYDCACVRHCEDWLSVSDFTGAVCYMDDNLDLDLDLDGPLTAYRSDDGDIIVHADGYMDTLHEFDKCGDATCKALAAFIRAQMNGETGGTGE